MGADFDDDAGENSGSAYVFRYDGSGWVQEAKLTASDAAANDYFGWSVIISGDTAVVGAPWDDDAGTSSGSAYVFRYDGTEWVEEAKLTASDAAALDVFGYGVAISGDTAVVGAFGDDDAFTDSGSAYVYELAADTPVGNCVVAQPIDNMTGTSPVTLIFSEVTQGGTTSLTTSNTGPSPPSGFILGFPPIYYELTTTATFSGPVQIQVCINYSGINFTGDEQNLRLYHYEYGVPVDVTVSVNAATNTICGIVTFLSPFAILQPKLDVDADGIDDFREAEFGPGGIIILNPTSSPPDTASLIGTASDGSTIITGDLTVDFPAGTTTSAAITIDYNDDEAPPGVGPSVTISGASLPASSTKSITMPFIDSEGYPMNSVCIDDTPNASVHGMTGGSCGVQNVHINIPIIDGGLNTSGPYSVYRSGTFITVAGLSHTAIAALQVRAQEGRRDVIQLLCMCLAEEVPWQFDQWFGTVEACIRALNSDPDVWCDFSCLTCAWYPFPCEPCREYMSPCKCQWPGPEGQ